VIYLDYSATTPVNKDVLDSFNKVCLNFPGNPNSLHNLGVECKNLIDEATNQIANLLKIKPNEIIYTSGATESNNTAIKGIALKYQNRGKHILTTKLEHSSTYGALSYLQKNGFTVDFLELDEKGLIDINDLKEKLTKETILVTINGVNSEIGIKQDINNLGKIIKENSNAHFHVDLTQMIGKCEVSFENIDLASFTAHKIYGLKGIGALYKKENIGLENLLHGGKSTTIYRSGTPCAPLIVSFSKALRLSLENLNEKYEYVKNLNKYVKENIDATINSNDVCVPHILNISVTGIKPETMLHALEEYQIYISTQSACATGEKSMAVYALTHNDELATHSLRISLSHLTTKEEIEKFVEVFNTIIRSKI